MVSVTSARPQRRPRPARAGEDDVLHLAAAQRLGALLAEHPGDRVDDVGLARAVRADDAGDARLEAQRGRRGEGLEALQREALEVHDSPVADGGGPAGEGPSRQTVPGRGRRTGQPGPRRAGAIEPGRFGRPSTGRSGARTAGQGRRRAGPLRPARDRGIYARTWLGQLATAAAAPAPGARRSVRSRAISASRSRTRVRRNVTSSTRRRRGLHRRSRAGPSPSRGPPHQTLRWVLGRARAARTSPARAMGQGSHAAALRSTACRRTVCPPTGHRSTKPAIPPRDWPHRSTTVRTRPGVPGSVRASSRAWQASRGPSATTSTRPSCEVRRRADQAELQRPGPDPPAEADPLHPPVHPGGQPDRRRPRSPAGPPRARLAGRAAVGRPVHERLAADRGAAPPARLVPRGRRRPATGRSSRSPR